MADKIEKWDLASYFLKYLGRVLGDKSEEEICII
jgi:hypothetical protein